MSPEEIQRREFSSAMRGYDKLEVRDFLRRVAAQVSAAQNGETSESDQSEATTEVTPLGPEDDRFEALGDRIAGLLRSAHESAAAVKENADNEAQATVEMAREAGDIMQAEAAEAADAMRIAAANEAASLRTAAEDEAEQVRAQARAAAETANQESERLRAEAEQYKAETEADADAYKLETEERATEFKNVTEAAAAEHKATVEAEVAEFKATTEAEAAELREASLHAGETELAEKREETERLLAEAADDREAAMAELADARAQVTELLEQARNQSDFLRHEADEIIRAKVRTQVERAEERLQVLRNSEVASRDRIATAHAELTAAMERLDATPVPELAPDTDAEVLEAAKARGEEMNWGAIEGAADDAPAALLDADVVDVDVVDTDVVESDVIESDVIESDVIETHDADVVEAHVVEADVVEADTDVVADAPEDEVTMAEVFGGTETDMVSDVADEADTFETEAVETEAVEHADVETDSLETESAAPDGFAADSFAPGAFEDEQMDAPVTFEADSFEADEAIEADDSELVSTFEVGDDVSDDSFAAPTFEDASVEEATAEATFPADSFVDQADSSDEHDSFVPQPSNFEAPQEPQGGHRHDDPAPVAETQTDYGYEAPAEYQQAEVVADDNADRIPVGVGADTEKNAPENEDALARLVREAMQRAVDSARTGD